MHGESYNVMKSLIQNYLNKSDKISILDVGSYDLNGSYRDIFDNPSWDYKGLDLEDGPNVDIVTEELYSWPLSDESFDVVISGQCLEHTEAPWRWIKEVARVCKTGGKVFIIAPWGWPEHRHPVDCWRIFPDGMKYLLNDAGFDVVYCDMGYANASQNLGDTWGVGIKKPAPKQTFLKKLFNRLTIKI
jgi:SAM-dependent methyltransferase